MGKTFSIARRELAGYFYSPLAYVIGALFLCVCAFKFAPPPGFISGSREWFILVPHQQASLRTLFEMMGAAMVVAAPLLTMRLLSEEFHVGTIETLMTAPVTDAQVVLGKFLGVLGFYLALLGSTLMFLVLMFIFARPDIGVVVMGYLGMILLGAAFLAVGLFASSLTRHQLLAAAAAIVILAFFSLLMSPAAAHLGEPWNQAAARLNAMNYLKSFARGLFDSRAVVFFLALTGGFLFLSIKMVESRRWR
ncbi:MAG: ABC transporter permease subunit [Phycisphaerae bacterium]|nr:ABC transporter permease subunit [Phycisphaerae bacterium]